MKDDVVRCRDGDVMELIDLSHIPFYREAKGKYYKCPVCEGVQLDFSKSPNHSIWAGGAWSGRSSKQAAP